MRITNLSYSPIDVLSELLSAYKCSGAQTKDFFSNERASHEWLVEQWSLRLDVVLDSFRRYGNDVYEQQHIRDHGIDIRMTLKDEEESRRIGFQIKSNNEANQDSKRKGGAETLVAVLKRQAFEASQQGGVNEWWVVPCFDQIAHKKRIQAINAELLSGQANSMTIKVVDPRKAMSLLSMDFEEIDTLCTLFLCGDDEIILKVRSEVQGMSDIMKSICLSYFGPALSGKRSCRVCDIFDLERDIDDDSGTKTDNLTMAVNALESDGFLSSDGSGEGFAIEPSVYPGLCALYFEGRVRNKLSEDDASEYVRRLALKACTF